MSRVAVLPKLLSPQQVADICGVHRTTVWRWNSRGLLPSPLQISDHTTRWRASEIRAWIAAGCPPRRKWQWEGGGDGD